MKKIPVGIEDFKEIINNKKKVDIRQLELFKNYRENRV